jgi:hypothetical protein
LVEVGNERVASADRLAKLSAYMKPSRMSFGSTGMPEAVEHSGHAGGGLGLVTGGVLGHVLGPVLGLTHGGGLGLALGAINKLSELRSSYHGFIGDVPRVVRTLAKMQGAVDHVAATVDRRAGQIVRGISKGSIIRGEVAAGLSQTHAKTPDEQKRVFDRRVAWVEKHQDPDAMVDAIGKGSEHISEHAPTVAAGVGITQQRIISHLSSLIPDRSSAGPLAEPKTVSLASMTRFNQAYEAADRPLSILRQAREGSLSQPALDAVKAIHPALYSRMQRAMVEKIASVKPGEIPRSARATLSRFLGPTDGGAARAISVMRVAQAPKPIPPRAMKLVSKASDRMSTPLDKLSSKV